MTSQDSAEATTNVKTPGNTNEDINLVEGLVTMVRDIMDTKDSLLMNK